MGKRVVTIGWLLTAITTAGWAQSRSYRVVSEDSRIDVHVGRAGLFKMFGHDHHIRVGTLEGAVEWNGDAPEEMQVTLDIDAASLRVDDEDLSEDDRTEVQATMEAEALAVTEHPTIVFSSTNVEADRDESGAYRLKIIGELELRGVRQRLEIPATLSVSGETLTARGELELHANEWGVPQISAVGGSVKTKSELGVEFAIVAVAR